MLDPVCNKDIDPRKASEMQEYKGFGIYFCSSQCAQAFSNQPQLYFDQASAMRLTIGVMGSAGNDHNKQVEMLVCDLGRVIGKRGFILITGACPGLPYVCATETRSAGGMSVGVSPALSLDEHIHKYQSPTDMFDVLIYTGSGLMGREVTNIRSSDMVIIVGGRSGTLGEFAIAYDEGKLIGVLQGSGGITEDIPRIVSSFGDKYTGAEVIYESDSSTLIDRLIKTYVVRHFHRPSCFC